GEPKLPVRTGGQCVRMDVRRIEHGDHSGSRDPTDLWNRQREQVSGRLSEPEISIRTGADSFRFRENSGSPAGIVWSNRDGRDTEISPAIPDISIGAERQIVGFGATSGTSRDDLGVRNSSERHGSEYWIETGEGESEFTEPELTIGASGNSLSDYEYRVWINKIPKCREWKNGERTHRRNPTDVGARTKPKVPVQVGRNVGRRSAEVRQRELGDLPPRRDSADG